MKKKKKERREHEFAYEMSKKSKEVPVHCAPRYRAGNSVHLLRLVTPSECWAGQGRAGPSSHWFI